MNMIPDYRRTFNNMLAGAPDGSAVESVYARPVIDPLRGQFSSIDWSLFDNPWKWGYDILPWNWGKEGEAEPVMPERPELQIPTPVPGTASTTTTMLTFILVVGAAWFLAYGPGSGG